MAALPVVTITYCSGLPMVSATAFESAAKTVFYFSSDKATVGSSFNNGILHGYTHGALPTSGENGETSSSVYALLVVWEKCVLPMHLRSIQVESCAGIKADETPRRFRVNEHII